MKLKLDENFDVRLVPELLKEGFDADTVIAEGLAGSPDETIYDTCKAVGRILVTLDLDFSTLRFARRRWHKEATRSSRGSLPLLRERGSS